VREAIGPLDRQDAVLSANFLQTQVVGCSVFQTIEICVVQGEPPAAIFVNTVPKCGVLKYPQDTGCPAAMAAP
jgi:hypothetical protein